MYNEQLEQLVDAALADGVLTEKEKQVLFKKAQTMGIDLDEFEMVLDARLVKLQKEQQEKAASSAPKSNKFGDVKKCPACGAMVQSYQGVCPECGYAFEGIDANSAVKELSGLLQKASNQKQMEKIIDNYPIPMEKASLMAFITWLRPQSTDSKNPLANSYFKKYAECVNKIKVSFSNDKQLQPFISSFENDEKKIKKQKIVNVIVSLLKNKWFYIGLVVFYVLFLIFKPKPINENPKRCNAAIIEEIDRGNLDKAYGYVIGYNKYRKDDIKQGINALAKAYFEQGDYEMYLKFADEETTGEYIRDVVIELCKNGQKAEARRFLRSHADEISDSIDNLGLGTYHKDGISSSKGDREYVTEKIKNMIDEY